MFSHLQFSINCIDRSVLGEYKVLTAVEISRILPVRVWRLRELEIIDMSTSNIAVEEILSLEVV